MAPSLEFVAIGDQRALGLPNLRCVPWVVQKHARALYERRLEAMRASTAEYLCFIDGGEDVLLPGFVEAMQALAAKDVAIGYAAELVIGVQHVTDLEFTLRKFICNHSLIHHGVVCRNEDLRAIKWPAGSYSWEVIAYGTLAQRSFAYDPTPRYDWRPAPTGARLWPTYGIAIISSKRFLNGLPAVRHGQPQPKGDA
jgi:hypothetical protein